MKRLAGWFVVPVVMLILTSGRAALPADAAKTMHPKDAADTCGRNDPDMYCPDCSHGKSMHSGKGGRSGAACQPGWGGTQGGFLEGQGLEGTRFSLAPGGSGKIFPPSAGTVLTDLAKCQDRPLELTIERCDSGTTARQCQVVVSGGDVPHNGICGQFGAKAELGVTIVQGYWNRKGEWQADPKVVTVACAAQASSKEAQSVAYDGALTRCVSDYRFEPKGKNEALTACIRMERADYCGDGDAHTYVGTNIDVHSPESLVERNVCVDNGSCFDDCTDGRCFEATWSSGGAICVGHSRWSGDLDFAKLNCSKTDFPDKYGDIVCRKGKKPSTKDLISRSKKNACGQEPEPCSSESSPDKTCPGCSGGESKQGAKKASKSAAKAP